MRDLGRRVLGALRLDAAIYEEVEHDPAAAWQALLVVVLAGAAAAVGHLDGTSPRAALVAMIVAILGWGIWASVTLAIGTRLLPEPQTKADLGELLRTLGFAAAPGLLQVLGVIRPLRPFLLGLCELWMIAAMVVAVRQALDYTSTLRAVAVCLMGWVLQALVAIALLTLLLPRPDAAMVRDVRHPSVLPTAGSVGVVRPSGVAPPVQ